MNTAVTAFSDTAARQKTITRTHISRHWPLWIWALLLIAVNMPLLWGQVRTGLLYLPGAVDNGQWWRVITYPLVHLSWYHLLLDAVGFLLLFSCLEEKHPLTKAIYIIGPGAGTLILASVLDPSISQRGLSGLSGIAHGLMAVSALEMLRHKEHRTWGGLSLALVVAKSAYELWSGRVLFEFMHMGLCGQPLAASHAGGVLGGVLAFLLLNVPSSMLCRPRRSSSSMGQYILRITARILSKTIYRFHHKGLIHIPNTGPAVLVCNHVSYIDWLFIAGVCTRPVHFVMHADYYRMPLLGRLFRTARVIPIASGREDPATLRRAFREIGAVLHNGGLVCIFPEGSLTRTGEINRFRSGIETIVRRDPAPVIPLAIRGLWGSFFSHQAGRPMRRWPRKIRRRVELEAGAAFQPRQVTAYDLQCVVQRLSRRMCR